MHKIALLTAGVIFAGTNLALAVPASVGTVGQLLTASESAVTLVRETKKGKKAKKRSAKPGASMNMKGMPPGHKM